MQQREKPFQVQSLGYVISTPVTIYCSAQLKETPCSHYILRFSLSKSISFAKQPHVGCNVKYRYAYAKSRNHTCCRINNWLSPFLNLHVHVTVPKWFFFHMEYFSFPVFFLSKSWQKKDFEVAHWNKHQISPQSWEILQLSNSTFRAFLRW